MLLVYQNLVAFSHLKTYHGAHKDTSTRGEVDIITVFGTVVPGSSPGGCTINSKTGLVPVLLFCEDKTANSFGNLSNVYFSSKFKLYFTEAGEVDFKFRVQVEGTSCFD